MKIKKMNFGFGLILILTFLMGVYSYLKKGYVTTGVSEPVSEETAIWVLAVDAIVAMVGVYLIIDSFRCGKK